MYFFDLIHSVDLTILDFIQNTIKFAFLDPVMAVISYIGEAGAIWVLTAVIMLFFKKTRATGVMVLCAMAMGYLIGELAMKNIICRPRPFTEFPDMTLNIKPPSGYSFPSGHSCSSFAASVVMLLRDKRFGIPAIILASLIAFSRLYNYVHFPSDVLCGILLGVLCACATVFIFEKSGALDNIGNIKNKRAKNNE